MIFSDGEDHLDRWGSRLDRLRQEDIVVHAIAIGDADERHPVPDGKMPPLQYRGEPVLSQRFRGGSTSYHMSELALCLRIGNFAEEDRDTVQSRWCPPPLR